MSPQVGWILQEEVVPRLRASIPRNVNQVGDEDPEELIQDATCINAIKNKNRFGYTNILVHLYVNCFANAY